MGRVTQQRRITGDTSSRWTRARGLESATASTCPGRHGGSPVRRLAVVLLALIVVVGCGGDDDDDDGRFGDPAALRDYRESINPIIDRVSAIEAEVEERAVGSSNVATAANLNTVYLDVRPRLLEALVDIDRLAPPRPLQQLHGDIRRLIILRLDAYRIVIDGFAAADESVYPQVEAKLREANLLIVDINLGLCEIDIALGDLEDCRLLAS